jgi:hypothetical protein
MKPFVVTASDYHEFDDAKTHYIQAGLSLHYFEIESERGKYRAIFFKAEDRNEACELEKTLTAPKKDGKEVKNIFRLYSSIKGWETPTKEIEKILNDSLKKIRSILENYSHYGASDTDSREAVAQYLFDNL